ncbi:MAG: Hpt domain-containing protein, partial [Acidobacteria bacterium]|nr:Hpt domain-containing protein [Acidobacteriota bacterium]
MTPPAHPLEDGELLASFVKEAQQYLERMKSADGLLESGRTASAEDLNRSAHALRGASSSLGLHELADGAAAAEMLGEGVASQRFAWRTEAAQALLSFAAAAGSYLLGFGDQPPKAAPESLLAASLRLENLAGGGGEADEIGELLRAEA